MKALAIYASGTQRQLFHKTPHTRKNNKMSGSTPDQTKSFFTELPARGDLTPFTGALDKVHNFAEGIMEHARGLLQNPSHFGEKKEAMLYAPECVLHGKDRIAYIMDDIAGSFEGFDGEFRFTATLDRVWFTYPGNPGDNYVAGKIFWLSPKDGNGAADKEKESCIVCTFEYGDRQKIQEELESRNKKRGHDDIKGGNCASAVAEAATSKKMK